MEGIFFNISIILGVTVALAFLMRLLRQPLLVAYLAAGIICGPLLLDVIGANHTFFETFAQFGVVLLLFAVGLGLNFSYLKRIGKIAFVAGLGQFAFTAIIGWLLLTVMHFSLFPALYLAIAMTFSSTIIVIKLLADKHDSESVYGRYTIGLMLVQDAIAVGLLLLLPALQVQSDLVVVLLTLVVKGIGIIAIAIILARFILPVILDHVAESGEFLFLFTIAWCFAVAGLAHWVGLSLEIGAIIAGISLGSSVYQTEIVSRIKPLRDFFIVLFFIILGSEMTVTGLASAWRPGLILSIFVLVGNPLILYAIYRGFHFSRRNSFLGGLIAAQVSEFGFVLLFLGQRLGAVGEHELNIFTFVALVTIFLSSYLITYSHQIYARLRPTIHRLFGKDKLLQLEDTPAQYDAWVFGYHRTGWKICEELTAQGVSVAVVDYHPRAINKLRGRQLPAFFGDASDVEFLSELPLAKAKLVVSTIPDPDDQLTMVKYVRSVNQRCVVICLLDFKHQLEQLYDAGANYVILPHLLGGEWIASILKGKHWNKATFATLRQQQRHDMDLRLTEGVD